jgi:hypothetical protein
LSYFILVLFTAFCSILPLLFIFWSFFFPSLVSSSFISSFPSPPLLFSLCLSVFTSLSLPLSFYLSFIIFVFMFFVFLSFALSFSVLSSLFIIHCFIFVFLFLSAFAFHFSIYLFYSSHSFYFSTFLSFIRFPSFSKLYNYIFIIPISISRYMQSSEVQSFSRKFFLTSRAIFVRSKGT